MIKKAKEQAKDTKAKKPAKAGAAVRDKAKKPLIKKGLKISISIVMKRIFLHQHFFLTICWIEQYGITSV